LQVIKIPTVSMEPATNITSTQATLNGLVNPNGTDTTISFEYGTQINSPGNLTGSIISTVTQDIGSGYAKVPVSVSITGLIPGTTYFFTIESTNIAGLTIYNSNMGSLPSFLAAAQYTITNSTIVFDNTTLYVGNSIDFVATATIDNRSTSAITGFVLTNITYPTGIQNPNLTASGTIAAGTSGAITFTLTGTAPLTAQTIDLSKLSCTLTPSS